MSRVAETLKLNVRISLGYAGVSQPRKQQFTAPASDQGGAVVRCGCAWNAKVRFRPIADSRTPCHANRWLLSGCVVVLAILLGLGAISPTVPEQFRGQYAHALGSCKSGIALIVNESTIDWNGTTDRVLFVERVSTSSAHLFLVQHTAVRGVVELHLELQGDKGDYLIAIDHLSDAEDIATRGPPVADKSTIGFYQRCTARARQP